MPPSFDYHDVCAFKNCIAHVYADFLNSAGILCMDVVFHLHVASSTHTVSPKAFTVSPTLTLKFIIVPGRGLFTTDAEPADGAKLVDHLFAGFSAGCGGRTLHRRGDGGSLGCLVLVEFHGVGRSVDHHLCLVVDNISDTDGELDAVDFILVFFEFHFRESERN